MDATERHADRATLAPILRDRVPYEHLPSEHMPLLWGADYIAWASGRKDYRGRLPPYVEIHEVP